MIAQDLLNGLDLLKIYGNLETEVSNIAYDSRKCKEGSMFVAIRGTQTDGHNYIDIAVSSGASVIVCEDIPDSIIGNMNILIVKVDNTRKALAVISHNFFGNPTSKLNIIGVTGTNGKTTTTYLLKSIFEANGEKCAIIGTTGILIGDDKIPATHTTPESLELAEYFLLMVQAGVSRVIMEVSSHALTQHRADCIDYSLALFTNLTPDHLDYHKDMFEYAGAKKILFDNLNETSKAIIFNNSEFSNYIISDCKAKIITIGRNEGDNPKIGDEVLNLGSSTFSLDFGGKKEFFSNQLTGRFNIDNSAIAITAALESGLQTEIVRNGLKNSKGAPGRMTQISLKNGSLALVDYAHTPDALEKALTAAREVLNGIDNPGQLICVFGCGGDRDKTKRPVMGSIAAVLADVSIVTDDNPRTENNESILDDIFVGIPAGTNAKRISDRAAAIEYACSISVENDIILVAGKGHEDYQIIGKVKHHFDDSEELKKWA